MPPSSSAARLSHCLGPAEKRRFCRENRTVNAGALFVGRTFRHAKFVPPACLCRATKEGRAGEVSSQHRTATVQHKSCSRPVTDGRLGRLNAPQRPRFSLSCPPHRWTADCPPPKSPAPTLGPCARARARGACPAGGRANGAVSRGHGSPPKKALRAQRWCPSGSPSPTQGPRGGPVRRPPPPPAGCRPG